MTPMFVDFPNLYKYWIWPPDSIVGLKKYQIPIGTLVQPVGLLENGQCVSSLDAYRTTRVWTMTTKDMWVNRNLSITALAIQKKEGVILKLEQAIYTKKGEEFILVQLPRAIPSPISDERTRTWNGFYVDSVMIFDWI